MERIEPITLVDLLQMCFSITNLLDCPDRWDTSYVVVLDDDEAYLFNTKEEAEGYAIEHEPPYCMSCKIYQMVTQYTDNC